MAQSDDKGRKVGWKMDRFGGGESSKVPLLPGSIQIFIKTHLFFSRRIPLIRFVISECRGYNDKEMQKDSRLGMRAQWVELGSPEPDDFPFLVRRPLYSDRGRLIFFIALHSADP